MRLETLLAFCTMTICAGPAACGGSVEVASGGGDTGGHMGWAGTMNTGTGGAGGTATTTDTGGGTTGTVSKGFCADSCAKTADAACFNTDECTTYCEMYSPGWTPEIGAAFAKCAAENPLCFETMEQCIFGETNPPGSPITVKLDGAGFDQFNGMTVHAWHDPDAGAPFGGEMVIASGKFAFEWVAPVSSGGPGALVLLYIDVDGDGSCVAAADQTASVIVDWNGDYLAPVFSKSITPPLPDSDFVCDFPP